MNKKILVLILLAFCFSRSDVKAANVKKIESFNLDNSEILRYPSPGANSFDYYFKDAYWQYRYYSDIGRKEWCLTVLHSQNVLGYFNEEINTAWGALQARFSGDYRWKNTESMRKQFYCHVRYQLFKQIWNLEPFRTNPSDFTCN